ncbi:MAG: WXG100 family type VII secretion target [Oscillospiraceae bacterium]|nr:WXG100 family type VII secretion target [Oscillospiraceae bacterium]
MAERILVSTEEIRQTAGQYQGAKGELQDAFTNLDRALKILESCWKGPAYMAMRAQWSVANGNIRRADEKMQDAIDELNKVANLFDENETALKSQFESLDTGTSPFDV